MATIRLRELRIEKKLTIKALADEIGIKESALSKYERAEREPNIETLILLADYFNVSVDYLIGHTNCIHEEYEPISNLLGVSEKTIEVLLSLATTTSKYSQLDYLEAIIQHPQFPSLLLHITNYVSTEEKGWRDLPVYDANGKLTNTITANVLKASSMQIIQNTFKGIIDGIPYSKHFLEK